MGTFYMAFKALEMRFKYPEQYAGCAAFSPACILQDLESI